MKHLGTCRAGLRRAPGRAPWWGRETFTLRSPRLVGQGEKGCRGGSPGSSIPSLQGRWLRWLHLLLPRHPELLSWQHTLGFRKEQVLLLVYPRRRQHPGILNRREGGERASSEHGQADLDLQGVQILQPPATHERGAALIHCGSSGPGWEMCPWGW